MNTPFEIHEAFLADRVFIDTYSKPVQQEGVVHENGDKIIIVTHQPRIAVRHIARRRTAI